MDIWASVIVPGAVAGVVSLAASYVQVDRALRFKTLLPAVDMELSKDRAVKWIREHPDKHIRRGLIDDD